MPLSCVSESASTNFDLTIILFLILGGLKQEMVVT